MGAILPGMTENYLAFAYVSAGPFTWAGYLRQDEDPGGWRTAVDFGNDVLIYLDGNNGELTFWNGDATSPAGVIVTGTWYHVALTRTAGAVATLYVDGVQAAQVAGVTNEIYRVRYGSSAAYGEAGYVSVGPATLWNVALSYPQVQAQYGHADPVEQTGVVATWKLAEGALEQDSSGNNNALTVTGTVSYIVGPALGNGGGGGKPFSPFNLLRYE
jgi:hypothetical protein